MGVYPADSFPHLQKNSFQIINSAKGSDIGEHWIMMANKNGKIFFGDSMGQALERYQNIRIPYKEVFRLVHKGLQNQPICGLYAIFFAWALFTGNTLGAISSDFHLMRFIQQYT